MSHIVPIKRTAACHICVWLDSGFPELCTFSEILTYLYRNSLYPFTIVKSSKWNLLHIIPKSRCACYIFGKARYRGSRVMPLFIEKICISSITVIKSSKRLFTLCLISLVKIQEPPQLQPVC